MSRHGWPLRNNCALFHLPKTPPAPTPPGLRHDRRLLPRRLQARPPGFNPFPFLAPPPLCRQRYMTQPPPIHSTTRVGCSHTRQRTACHIPAFCCAALAHHLHVHLLPPRLPIVARAWLCAGRCSRSLQHSRRTAAHALLPPFFHITLPARLSFCSLVAFPRSPFYLL
jgi:hypothetical protein